jgi:hypothetical protein
MSSSEIDRLLDLRSRASKAKVAVAEMERVVESRGKNSSRLHGKVDGIGLVISYLDETIREAQEYAGH